MTVNFSKFRRPVCQIPWLTATISPNSAASYLSSKLRTFWITKRMTTSVTLCIKCSIIVDFTSSVDYLCCSGVLPIAELGSQEKKMSVL